MATQRTTVDLTAWPDLVVIYLGMQVRSLKGLRTLQRVGPGLNASVRSAPDGLLGHENFLMSLWPLHVAFRQYWRDLESLEAFTKALPHQAWWTTYLRDTGGTGFWHETYSARGGIEAIYLDLPAAPGLGRFAPLMAAKGPMLAARGRLRRD